MVLWDQGDNRSGRTRVGLYRVLSKPWVSQSTAYKAKGLGKLVPPGRGEMAERCRFPTELSSLARGDSSLRPAAPNHDPGTSRGT